MKARIMAWTKVHVVLAKTAAEARVVTNEGRDVMASMPTPAPHAQAMNKDPAVRNDIACQ